MQRLFPLKQIDSFGTNEIQAAIEDAPVRDSLRDAVGDVVRAIHGLPKALGCELRQMEVYLGRAGRRPDHLLNRWKYRLEKFSGAPSTHALALLRTSTVQLRDEGWERAAQRVVGSLDRNKALCCANVVAGSNGPWPTTRQTIIYVVARIRPGRIGELSTDVVNRAVRDLMDERNIDPAALVEAGRLIPRPDQFTVLDVATPKNFTPELATEMSTPLCRESGCTHPARDRNFGFCGYHRRILPADERCRAPTCLYMPLPGNYGFCGVHRDP